MAILIPALGSCVRRMMSGERRFAERLEALLESDYLCWYDVPVGSKYQHPDFVILHPGRGVLILEVKDWKRETIQRIDPVRVTLMTDVGLKEELNPLVQARQNAFAVKNVLERDMQLQAPVGHAHQGKLVCPYGFGIVFSNITRKQFNDTDLGEVLPPHLVICKDEMYESVSAETFQKMLWGMFNVQFQHLLTLPQIERIRWHLFPEIRITQGHLFGPQDATVGIESSGDTLMRVMDIQQEQLARSMGEGHRVIHGVAGSGKTLILGYRCEQLAKTMDKPILVLVYNVALASKLEQMIAARGLSERVTVRNFHRWCLDQLTLYHIIKPSGDGDEFYQKLVTAVIDAVERGQIPRGQYGAVLIDEGHDFEADWLKLVTQMIDPLTNSLLLLYDDAQSIYGKKRAANFSFKSLGIYAQGRTTVLRINYRNTNEILHCAYTFAKEVLIPADAVEDDVPLVMPEVAGRHGPTPRLIRFNSPTAEVQYIIEQLNNLSKSGTPWRDMAVLHTTWVVANEISRQLQKSAIPFEWLRDSRSKRYKSLENSVKVMTLQSSKGLEFPVVAIVGIGSMPLVEEQLEAKLLYVGMTRATERLFLTASKDNVFVKKLIELEQAA
ncbi:MAG: DEAD/DEAH box helicase [Steroidobacteraceae bacterium]